MMEASPIVDKIKAFIGELDFQEITGDEVHSYSRFLGSFCCNPYRLPRYINCSHIIEKDDGNEIALSDKGAFWLHALEDLFSLDYIGKLWGTSEQEPWPEKIVL